MISSNTVDRSENDVKRLRRKRRLLSLLRGIGGVVKV